MLEEVYSEIVDMNIPVNFSIIPCMNTGYRIKNNLYSRLGLEHEPFIPKEHRERNEGFPITDNRELLETIRNMRSEIVQHGFTHNPNEFLSSNKGELERKIVEGRGILEESFGAKPTFFSAPNDGYSPASLQLLREYFLGATYGAFTLRNLFDLHHGTTLPLGMVSSYLNAVRSGEVFLINDGFLLIGHNGLSINPFENMDDIKRSFASFIKKERVIVIAQHYWEYYYQKQSNSVEPWISKERLATFIDVIQSILREGAQFLTFSEFRRKVL